MEIPLRDYLSGHVLRTAMVLFEDALGPWVKEETEAHFHRTAPGESDRIAAEHEAALKAHADNTDALAARRVELARLNLLLSTSLNHEKQAVAREMTVVKDQVKKLEDAVQTPPVAPVPWWIEECRVFFGATVKPYVNASNHWDVHIIVVVMRGLLRDVFAQHMPDHFHAKELLRGILRVLSMRSTRAHRVAVVESDVLSALQQMTSVMKQCRCEPKAVAAMTDLLDKVKALVHRAGMEGDTVCAGPALSADEINAQRLYMTLSAWEQHCEAAIGSAVDGSGGGALCNERFERLAYENGTVVIASGLDTRWTKVLQDLKTELPTVAKARHWYVHSPFLFVNNDASVRIAIF